MLLSAIPTYKMDKQDKPKEVDGIDELKGIFE
jgi:hypothetical protein